MSNINFIGMDDHKEIFNLCAFNGTTGEIILETRCAANVKNVHKFVLRIQDQSEEEVLFKCGYKGGCLGYARYHSLTALGLECNIFAPSTKICSSKNKVIKNDKLDARMIAQKFDQWYLQIGSGARYSGFRS